MTFFHHHISRLEILKQSYCSRAESAERRAGPQEARNGGGPPAPKVSETLRTTPFFSLITPSYALVKRNFQMETLFYPLLQT